MRTRLRHVSKVITAGDQCLIRQRSCKGPKKVCLSLAKSAVLNIATATSKEKLNVPSTTPPKSDVPKIETSIGTGDKRATDKKDKSKDKEDKDVKDVKEGAAHKAGAGHKRPGHRRVASEALSPKDLIQRTVHAPAITTDTSHVIKSDKDGKKDKKGKDKKNKVKSNTLKKKSSADSTELTARSESEQSESLAESPHGSVKSLQSEPVMHTPPESGVPSRTSAPELKTGEDGAGNMAVELVKRIGKGATATVWQGLLNGQPVALKQVHLGVRLCDGVSWHVTHSRSIFRI